jgi:hypothetical protein
MKSSLQAGIALAILVSFVPLKTYTMDKHLKDKATPKPGHNDTGVGGQFDPNQGKGSIEDTKPRNSTINNPPKEQTKDDTAKARDLANEDDQAH